MSDRKPISKKIRFEVLKRDSFKCQYCGACAPDVLLQVDHINPVAKGGDNDIINLITSCIKCNQGKSDIPLSDHSAVEKSRKQLEELQERHEQLEMMMEWRNGLRGIEDRTIELLCDHWSKIIKPYCLTDGQKSALRMMLKRFSAQEIMEAMDISGQQYIRFLSDWNLQS